MHRAALLSFAATLWLLLAPRSAPAAEADTFSPVVSYQYLDSLSTPDSPTPLTSAVVSYQYFDWPGDENLTFTNSPQVSYHYHDGVTLITTGRVRTPQGTNVPGAQVTIQRGSSVFWRGVTESNGKFFPPALALANYTVTVTKAGFVTLADNVLGTVAGIQILDLRLVPLLAAPSFVAANSTPAVTAIRTPVPTDPADQDAPRLKLFNGRDLVEVTDLDSTRMTIVLSHGWRSSPDEWAKPMALQIRSRLGAQAANIVVWDWQKQADRALVGGIDVACDQGILLGQALQQKLGYDYQQHVHFIGHSFGTLVNGYACDYVHAGFSRDSLKSRFPWNKSLTQPHVTLLDEAEVATVFGENVTTAAAIGWKAAQLKGALIAGGVAAVADWKNPIPKSAVWVDNYISAVGLQRDQAVNVCLTAPSIAFLSPVVAHGYAHQWYRHSVSPSGIAPALGFGSSMEAAGTFPPTGLGKTAGSLWYENLVTSDPLDLNFDPDPEPFEANMGILASYSVQGAATVGNSVVYKPLDSVGQAVLSGYELGLTWVGEKGGTVVYGTQQVLTEASQKVGLWWDAYQDAAADVMNSINPDTLLATPLGASTFKIRLRTLPDSPQLNGSAAAAAITGRPAYAWLNVDVPTDAGFMAFDFMVTGDPKEDRIACAVNDQNLFTLAAKYVPDAQWGSTDLLDVSAYAGQTVTLFFGLAGGTSSDCEVAVDGIRFVTIPKPKLGISDRGPKVALKWPAASRGWLLEGSDTLAPDSWLPIVTEDSVSVESGVATVEQLRTGPRKFYRLRRAP